MSVFFFFNDTATTEIYTLSLHDALPISFFVRYVSGGGRGAMEFAKAIHCSNDSSSARALAAIFRRRVTVSQSDRKSTRLNSSHSQISYAVFCLKKKKSNSTSTADSLHTP